jgi:hypothetical protein
MELADLMMMVPIDQPGFVGTYICPACKKFFKTLEELRAHEASVHGKAT